MTCVLVTGGSGFIGQHLVATLVASGRQTRVLDLRPPGRAVANAQYFKGSVLDRELVNQALDGVDEVYHLAGLPGMSSALSKVSSAPTPPPGAERKRMDSVEQWSNRAIPRLRAAEMTTSVPWQLTA